MRTRVASLLTLSLALATAALPARQAFANPGPPFTVEVTDDWPHYPTATGLCISQTPAGAQGPCTLRAAVTAANQLGGGPLTITVPAGTYTLVNGAMRLDQVNLDIIGACCDAAGAPTTVIDGGSRNNNAFSTCGTGCGPGGNTFNLTNLTFRNFGAGAIYNTVGMNLRKVLITSVRGRAIGHFFGSMTLTDVTITGNQGGAIGTGGNSLLTGNNLTVTNNTITTGAPIFNDNGASNRLFLSNSDISNNVGIGIQAGGIYTGGNTVLENVSITGNVLDPPGEGCCGPDPGSAAGLFVGDHPQVTVTGGSITGNSIVSGARPHDVGGVYVGISGSSARFTMNGTLIDSNSGSTGGMFLVATDGASTQASGISVTNNAGSGIVGGSTVPSAGGIAVEHAPVSLTDSTIDSNSSAAPGFRQAGGLSLCCNQNLVTLSGVTITNNDGIGLSKSGSNLDAANTTISGNSGGIDLNANWSPIVRLTNLTIAQNGAPGGLLYGTNSGNLQLKNTIIATNTAANCVSTSPVPSLGSNLEGNDPGFPGTGSGSSCRFSAAGDQSNAAPLLGPLADNGGPTFTHALGATSPAVDGVLSGCPPPATDQRGVVRPQGPRCDIGAFELETPGPATIPHRPKR